MTIPKLLLLKAYILISLKKTNKKQKKQIRKDQKVSNIVFLTLKFMRQRTFQQKLGCFKVLYNFGGRN